MKAVVAGLPKSWQTAPSITAICCGRGRSSIRRRASSTTISVCTQTSPSGCHSGSCSAIDQRLEFGEQPLDDADVARQRQADGRPRRAEQEFLELTPDPFRGQVVERESRGRPPRVGSSTSNSRRAASCTARSTRRLSSPNVSGSTMRSRLRGQVCAAAVGVEVHLPQAGRRPWR